MKNAEYLLHQLEKQIALLGQQLSQSKWKQVNESRFDPQLFLTTHEPAHKISLAHYLTEIEQNFDFLKETVATQQTEKVAYIAEKLVNQIAALHRELATQQLRLEEPKAVYTETPYQVHSRYLDYQRRLVTMRIEQEEKLQQARAYAEKQQIQTQLAALENRITRCNAAIAKLERQLESDIVTNRY
ncbi:primosomal replication protein PriC [Zophobihabitans entericus]|uniref:Prephenate dehydrogenase n=1 Tax=Zophobihabitans entericus TaxID=1635327 RepID=A0A6G9IAS6_9GAMM|nr:primosomal replication protein [Zophobihabitans entericus]QIQ21335.1 prephenate dehydrogenase [Zophobihabitans entericus]